MYVPMYMMLLCVIHLLHVFLSTESIRMPSMTRLLWKCRSVYTLNVVLIIAIFLTIIFTYGMNNSNIVHHKRVILADRNMVKRDISSIQESDSQSSQSSGKHTEGNGLLNSLHPDIYRRIEVCILYVCLNACRKPEQRKYNMHVQIFTYVGKHRLV